MIDGRSVLAIITARGGSKGLPRKNILDVGGKPLIGWSIDSARQSALIDRLILSSEDEEIISTAKRWHCDAPFKRPDSLASDEASIYDVLLHALDQLDESYDFIVLLQPTSPLRSAEDIDRCIRLCHQSDAPAAVSVTTTPKSPYWMYRLDDAKRMMPLLDNTAATSRRQDLPATYAVNGAVYVARTDWFREKMTFIDKETRAYVMPTERSIDIDTDHDMKILRMMIGR